jgi:hypothetical protein
MPFRHIVLRNRILLAKHENISDDVCMMSLNEQS